MAVAKIKASDFPIPTSKESTILIATGRKKYHDEKFMDYK